MKELLNVVKSFEYALSGLRHAFRHERNMKVHLFMAILVLICGLWLQIDKWKVLMVLVAIVFVIFAELMNTAIENVVDLLTEEHRKKAKVAKDVAAGAVLVAAGFAVIAGALVFAEPLLALEPFFILGLALVFLVTLMFQVWAERRHEAWIPSLLASLISAAALQSGLYFSENWWLCIWFLAVSVTGLLAHFLFGVRFRPILLGALIGLIVACLAYQLSVHG
jgi:diacylglycerol kinase (ATP)